MCLAQDQLTSQLRFQRAWRSPGCWAVLLLVAFAGLVADLGSKNWAFKNVADEPVVLDRDVLLHDRQWVVPPHPPLSVLPGGMLNLHLVVNHGAVFGIGPNQRVFFIAFTLAALSAALVMFGRQTTSRDRSAHLALGLVLAGGLGNLHDRVNFGAVRDFLHLFPGRSLPFGWRWPGGSPELFPWVFNLADLMLLAGMLMLLAHLHRHQKRSPPPVSSSSMDANIPC